MPQCCLHLPIALAGMPETAVKECGPFSAKLSWAACSGMGDTRMGGSALYMMRGSRVFFLKDLPVLGTPGPKAQCPVSAFWEPIRGGTQLVLPASPEVPGPCSSMGSIPACTCPARPGLAPCPLMAQPTPPHPTPSLLDSPHCPGSVPLHK